MAEQEQNLERRVNAYISRRERVRDAYAGRVTLGQGDPQTLRSLEEELNVLGAFYRGLLVGRGQEKPTIEIRHASDFRDGVTVEEIKFDEGEIIRTNKTEG